MNKSIESNKLLCESLHSGQHAAEDLPVPYIQKCLRVYNRVLVLHVTYSLPDPPHTTVTTFCSTCVSPPDSLVVLHEVTCKASSSATCMVMCVHFINEKASVCKVASLTDEAVWCKLTGKIVDHDFRSDGEAGIDGREDIVTTFSNGNSVKTEADTMGTPKDKDAASQFVA